VRLPKTDIFQLYIKVVQTHWRRDRLERQNETHFGFTSFLYETSRFKWPHFAPAHGMRCCCNVRAGLFANTAEHYW